MSEKAPRDLSTDVVLPADPAELARCLADANWRIGSGLYKIIVKGDDDEEGTILNFRPNRAQRRFIARLHYRNLILKARQLGFTTLICILWLDHALFNRDQRVGIIAQDREVAAAILRDKVKLAYDKLPEVLKARMPIRASNASEILFAHNNSSIRVATTMRGGTIHRLHISEYGKICAKFPDKAKEVQTGSLPAVPVTGIAVIESTAEGMDGDFKKKSDVAQALHDLGRKLGIKDWRFHFYAWWQEPKYRMDPSTVVFTADHDDYFEDVEFRTKTTLDLGQRAWYVATKQSECSDDDETMWREYPSYPEEAFKVSTEGTYYAKQLQQARREGRIGLVPYMPGYPVHTFWDIGLNDLTAVWFMQVVGAQYRFINYIEEGGQGPAYFVGEMQRLKYVYGYHYLPHDGAARRMTIDKPETYKDMLHRLDVTDIIIVPRIPHLTTGINMVRDMFPGCWFDEKNCAKGLTHLQNYKKEWNTRLGCWGEHPVYAVANNGSDAFRQFAQGYKGTPANKARRRSTNWRTA